jgi:hypothetical protein
MTLTDTATATIDGVYRYDLRRTWDTTQPLTLFVMLNPSTGNDIDDDHTIRRCRHYAKRQGAGGLIIVNLYALRSSTPTVLLRHRDPIGPHNDGHLARWLAATEVATTIAAWGTHRSAERREPDLIELAEAAGRPLHSLGTNRNGSPCHPLYLRNDAPLEPYFTPRYTRARP